jgi:hypothetical protein
LSHARGITAALLAGAAALAVALNAGAAPAPKTLYVGASAGTNKNCSSPGYTSVQTAVDAATNGATVYLCGTAAFTGPVVINKSITLTGDNGAGIGAPASAFSVDASRLPAQFTGDNLFLPQALLVVTGAGTNAKINGLTISGVLPGNGGCAEQEFGILVIGGANVAISNDQVLDIRDSNSSLDGCQFGVGIQVGRKYWPTADFSTFPAENLAGTAQISNTTVSGYQKNGITVDGPGSKADLKQNTVTGDGPNPIIAQNGIQISRGGSAGPVEHNTVSNNQYTGPGYASAGGILLYGGCGDEPVTGVDVHNNTLVNNDVGIYLNNYDDSCHGPAATLTRDDAHNNAISNSAVTNTTGFDGAHGYQAGVDDIGNGDDIHNNTISGAGYASQGTVSDPTPAFVRPIDTESFATTNPNVHNNKVR